MLTPISSVGETPIIAARERLTRSTLSVSSCTTMKSLIASKFQPVSIGLLNAGKERAFWSAMAA